MSVTLTAAAPSSSLNAMPDSDTGATSSISITGTPLISTVDDISTTFSTSSTGSISINSSSTSSTGSISMNTDSSSTTGSPSSPSSTGSISINSSSTGSTGSIFIDTG